MFTGIIEGTGTVVDLRRGRRSARLRIRPSFSTRSLKRGDSVAVNGCCLTVSARQRGSFWSDLSPETLRVTNLGRFPSGARVNLERAVRASDRLGGHLVQGHVDGTGHVLSVKRNHSGVLMEVSVPESLRRFLIHKGSISVDGVSMTVQRFQKGHLTLVVVPHTLKVTNFRDRKAGDRVNLEVDIIGKYIEAFLRIK